MITILYLVFSFLGFSYLVKIWAMTKINNSHIEKHLMNHVIYSLIMNK